ncbi:hypothetical protein [Ktedonospora formicarum]|uniref:Uncharacterized protein n=1 Tax=Ktedonospora formicarum TaxID=2778364 RepID=A0A8J3MRF3_9CHLR|nr:hypothetical protein [Ktedonospora formicarum]GHO45972.1 hypothetical protein KSX_41350 [Ktedonospora formicarum]
MNKVKDEALIQRAIAIERALTYVGTFTMIFGLILIMRTRGFGNLLGSTWGTLIIMAFGLAVVLLGVGDSGLRPALKHIKEQGEAPARRWAIIGFILTVLAVGVMTGATYVI